LNYGVYRNLKHLVWTSSYFSTIFAIFQILEIHNQYFLEKKIRWARSKQIRAETAQAGPVLPAGARETKLKRPDEWAPLVSGRGRLKGYAATSSVGLSRDQRLPAVVFLRPRAVIAETLARSGPHRGSPRVAAGRREGDGADAGLSATSGMALERRLALRSIDSIRDSVNRGEVRTAISDVPDKEEG
jgi:hypothetical protein